MKISYLFDKDIKQTKASKICGIAIEKYSKQIGSFS